jgi:hypothetical protein
MYRISTSIPGANLQSSQLLLRDKQPLLFQTGMKGLLPVVEDAVARTTLSLGKRSSMPGQISS